jgi:hypothetical protein
MNGYELLAQYEKQIKECFTVPNNLLPEEFQDNRTDHVSLQDIEDKCNQRDAETEYQQTQREKTRRIYLYKQMVERGEEISYLPK